ERRDDSGSSTDYTFTGKERDPESGLTHMEARYYSGAIGQFASPDPRFVEAARLAIRDEDRASFESFIATPQMANTYAYGLRNPVKYVDPNGMEVVLSKTLKSSPGFMKAWRIFKSTSEGKRILSSLEKRGEKVYIRASLPGVRDGKVGTWTDALYDTFSGPGEGDRLGQGESAFLINLAENKLDAQRQGLNRDQRVATIASTIHSGLADIEHRGTLREMGQHVTADEARTARFTSFDPNGSVSSWSRQLREVFPVFSDVAPNMEDD